jgi:RecA-family ATPase
MSHNKRDVDLNQPQDGEIIPFSPAAELYSREAEQSVLGGLMLGDEGFKAWAQVKKILVVGDFFLREHQILWATIEKVILGEAQPDIITLGDQLEKDNAFAAIGGSGYLGQLVRNTPGTANILAYTKIVRERSLKREKMHIKQALLSVEGKKEAELLTQLKITNDALNQLGKQCGESLFDQLKQSFAEVAAMEFDPVQWIVQDILPAGVSMLCAKPKQGKSWFALDLAMAVAAGASNALGCKQAVKGDVLYFALEDNQRRMNTRIKKLIFDRFESAPSNAYLITGVTVPRLNQGFESELDKYLESYPKTRFVVVDPFTFIETPPKHKQPMRSYQEDYEAINRLTALTREKYPHVAIVLVYHMRKEGSGNWLDTVMGTTGLAGAVDNLMFMRRENAQSDAVFYLTGKDIENECEYAMTFDKVTACWQLQGDAHEYAISKERREILDCLGDDIKTPKEIAAELDKSHGNIKYLLADMFKNGQVDKVDKGKYKAIVKETVYPPQLPLTPLTLLTLLT